MLVQQSLWSRFSHKVVDVSGTGAWIEAQETHLRMTSAPTGKSIMMACSHETGHHIHVHRRTAAVKYTYLPATGSFLAYRVIVRSLCNDQELLQ